MWFYLLSLLLARAQLSVALSGIVSSNQGIVYI